MTKLIEIISSSKEVFYVNPQHIVGIFPVDMCKAGKNYRVWNMHLNSHLLIELDEIPQELIGNHQALIEKEQV